MTANSTISSVGEASRASCLHSQRLPDLSARASSLNQSSGCAVRGEDHARMAATVVVGVVATHCQGLLFSTLLALEPLETLGRGVFSFGSFPMFLYVASEMNLVLLLNDSII